VSVGGRKVAAGFGWVALMSYSNNVLSLLATLLLARLLGPHEFGIIGVASMTIEIVRMAKDMGLSEAIVYQKRDDHIALDTANTILVGFNVGLFVIACIAAPFVASFYKQPIVTPVLIVMATSLLWDALRAVPRALMRKNVDFRRLVIPEVVPIVVSTTTSVMMAFTGFGVWSLVVKTVLHSMLGAWLLRNTSTYTPRFRFDRTVARELFSYGQVIATTTVLLVILYNLDRFFVSKLAGLAALGAYDLALRIAEMPVKNFSFLVGSVMFPVFSKLDSTRPALRQTFLKTLRYTGFVSMPAAIGLALYGPALVNTFYGPRWQAMVDPLRVLCLYALLRSLSSIVLDAVKATGHPQIMRRVVITKLAIVGTLGIPALEMFGVIGICWLIVATYVVSFTLELWALCRLLELKLTPTLGALALPSGLSVTIVPAIYWILTRLSHAPDILALVAGIVVTVLAYAGAVSVCDKHAVADVRSLVTSGATA
jgi:PST family polysaccharide transporter